MRIAGWLGRQRIGAPSARTLTFDERHNKPCTWTDVLADIKKLAGYQELVRQLRTARNQGEVQASCPGSHLGDHPAARSYGHDDGRFLVFRPYSKRWPAVPAVSVRRTLAMAVFCRDPKSRHRRIDESKWADHQDLFSARVARSGVVRRGARAISLLPGSSSSPCWSTTAQVPR